MSVGRYTKVRGWLADRCVTPPLLIDRRNGAPTRMYPCLEGGARYEWDALKDQAVRQVERHRREVYEGVFGRPRAAIAPLRIAGLFSRNEFLVRHLLFNGLAATTYALDSNYAAGSAGDAIGKRIQMFDGKTLDTVYFFISSYAGTAANVNDIDLELRPEPSVGAILPDTATLTEGKTVNPSSATGWIASTGWTSSLAAGSRYWIIVGDADGGSGHSIVAGLATTYHDAITAWGTGLGYHVQTTGGFASGNSASAGRWPMLVLKYADGTIHGNSLSASTSSASTNQRGYQLATDAFVNDIDVFGFVWSVQNASLSGVKIYKGSAGPASGEDHVSTDLFYNPSTKLGAFVSGHGVYRFNPGTAYRVVATYSGSTTGGPQKLNIGTGADATLRLAMPGSGKFTWTIENAGSWSDDNDATAGLMFLLDAEVVPANSVIIPKRKFIR